MSKNSYIEEAQSEDYSSSDLDTYIPDAQSDKLEVDESVYNLLEYITLEWPSQTISLRNNEAFVATNPPADKDKPMIVILDFEETNNFHNVSAFQFEKIEIDFSINRMRTNKQFAFAVSDNRYDILDSNMNTMLTIDEEFSYGMFANDKIQAVGKRNGNIIIFDELFNRREITAHTSNIESIKIIEDAIYTAGIDNYIKSFDLRTDQLNMDYKLNTEVNSIDVLNNYIIAGDDNGDLTVLDIRNYKQPIDTIKWHKSPISMVKWKDSENFVSLSDEQVCFWDMDFIEEWEYHKWLKFVHSGQRFYKDIDFTNDINFLTSENGICLFSLKLD